MNGATSKYVAVSELKRLLKDDSAVTLIDARTFEEFEEGHVPVAINVPIANLTEFATRSDDSNDGVIVTMCGSTGRGEKAAAILASHGLENVFVLEGGLKAWRDAGLPVAQAN